MVLLSLIVEYMYMYVYMSVHVLYIGIFLRCNDTFEPILYLSQWFWLLSMMVVCDTRSAVSHENASQQKTSTNQILRVLQLHNNLQAN